MHIVDRTKYATCWLKSADHVALRSSGCKMSCLLGPAALKCTSTTPADDRHFSALVLMQIFPVWIDFHFPFTYFQQFLTSISTWAPRPSVHARYCRVTDTPSGRGPHSSAASLPERGGSPSHPRPGSARHWRHWTGER